MSLLFERDRATQWKGVDQDWWPVPTFDARISNIFTEHLTDPG